MFKFSPEQQKRALTLVVSGIILIVFYNVLTHLPWFVRFLKSMIFVFMPFILGFAFAFILAPVMYSLERSLFKKIKKPSLKRSLATFTTLILALALVAFFIVVIVPGLFTSISRFVSGFDGYSQQLTTFFNDLSARYNLSTEISDVITSAMDQLLNYFSSFLTQNVPNIINASISIFSRLMNVFLGFIVSIYILMDRERFALQIKRVTYAILPLAAADYAVRLVKNIGQTFRTFILERALNSLVIGLVSFIVFSLLRIEYAGIISVFIALANMIPVFGPYLGAIPSVIILLMVNPSQIPVFLIALIIIQQLEHQFIAKRIIGDSLRLPTFWILFAMVLGGGLFGIVGMFVCVPLFAVIYSLTSQRIKDRLKKREVDADETV